MQTAINGLMIIIVLSISSLSFGTALPSNPLYQNDIQRFEQKQRLEREQQQRDILQQQQTPSPPLLLTETTENQPCVPIKKITLRGSSVVTQSAQNKLFKPYLTQCLSINKINNLIKEITNLYISKGYITSQAYIAEQSITDQHLVLDVIEGKIASMNIEGASPWLISMIFPNLVNGILNLRDLEQGLEQLNQQKTQQYRIDIQPADKTGYSQILVKLKTTKKWGAVEATFDNSGSPETGKYIASGTLFWDQALGLGEYGSFNISTDTDFKHTHFNRYYSANFNLPYGYWSYHYQFYHSQTLQPFSVQSDNYPYRSENINQQFDLSRLIYRDGTQRLILQGHIKHKQAISELAGQELLISSPTLTSLSFNAQYSRQHGQGVFTLTPTVYLGISALGASDDYIAAGSPRSHFRKISIAGSYQHLFAHNLSYLTSFYGQYSPDNLYSAERVTIGGQHSVRGYQQQSLSGNRGFYWRNELQKSIFNSKIGQFGFIAALDYGEIIKDHYEVDGQRLIGAALGINYHHAFFPSQVFVSKPLRYPSTLKPEQYALYWSASISL